MSWKCDSLSLMNMDLYLIFQLVDEFYLFIYLFSCVAQMIAPGVGASWILGIFILFIFCSANRDSEIELSTGITAIICSKSYDWFCL